MKNKSQKPLIIILILLIIFIAPFQIAKRIYLHDASFFHKGSTQHGYLIQPPLKINQLTSYDFKGKWLLLYIGPNNCPAPCKKNLYQLQQIHTALGKDQSRILRVKISFEKDEIPKEYPGFLQLTVSKQQFLNFIKNSPISEIKTLALSMGAIYLVDPLGNVMMVYTLDSNPSGLFKDLKHLLGVSQIG